MDFNAMTSAELVKTYNQHAKAAGLKHVMRFSDRKTAIRRVQVAVQMAAEKANEAEYLAEVGESVAVAKKAAKSKPAKAAKPVATAKADRSYMVKPQYRAKYEVVKNDDGSRTLDNGDPIATALRGMTLDGIRAVAATVLGRSQRVLRDEYEHLNPGQQSMTLRNLIRKAYRADGGDKSFQQAVKEVA
jgi:hypothetical protein